MLTWKLWHALRHPPYQNPIFRRIYATATPANRMRQLAMLLFGYLAFCLVFSSIWPYLFAAPSFTLALVIGIANTIYGVAWTSGISAAIAKEHELKTYDLLALQPTGALGTDWALSTGTLHKSTLFRDLPRLIQVFAIAFMAALGIIGLFIIATDSSSEEGALLLVAAVQGIALAAAFYFDHIQSLVLANLVGMMTPLHSPDRLNARIWAVGGFLLLKLAIHMVTLATGFFILPNLISLVSSNRVFTGITLAVVQLLLFYHLHEAVIAFLWSRFTQTHSATGAMVTSR